MSWGVSQLSRVGAGQKHIFGNLTSRDAKKRARARFLLFRILRLLLLLLFPFFFLLLAFFAFSAFFSAVFSLRFSAAEISRYAEVSRLSLMLLGTDNLLRFAQ